MRQVQCHRDFARTRSVLVASVACALLAVWAAGAATAARSSAARSADLCGASKSVAASIVSSTNTKNIAGSPTQLKAFWGKVKNAEPTVLAAASGKRKTQLTHVFGFVNTVVGDLNKVNWNYTALLPDEKSLVAQANKVAPDLKALKAYYNNVCHLAV